VLAMAQPSKKGPSTTVKISCAKCGVRGVAGDSPGFRAAGRQAAHAEAAWHAAEATEAAVVAAAAEAVACRLAAQAFIYKYRKGGKGALVKCFVERIEEDAANGSLMCPGCGIQFARPAIIRGRPANKIVGGKVIVSK